MDLSPTTVIHGLDMLPKRLRLSNAGRYVSCDGYDGAVYVWETDKGDAIHRFSTGKSDACAWAFSADERKIAVGYKSIGVWDLESKKKLGSLSGHRQRVNSLAFHSSGTKLLSASGEHWTPADCSVRAWDLASGMILARVSFRSPVRAVCFLRSEKEIWVHTEKRAYLADAASFEPIAEHDFGEKRIVSWGSWGEHTETMFCMTESLDELFEVDLRTGQERKLDHPFMGLKSANVYDLNGNRTETQAAQLGELTGFESLVRSEAGNFWIFYSTVDPGYHIINERSLHTITCEEPVCLTTDADGQTIAFLSRSDSSTDFEIHVWKTCSDISLRSKRVASSAQTKGVHMTTEALDQAYTEAQKLEIRGYAESEKDRIEFWVRKYASTPAKGKPFLGNVAGSQFAKQKYCKTGTEALVFTVNWMIKKKSKLVPKSLKIKQSGSPVKGAALKSIVIDLLNELGLQVGEP